MTDKIKVIISNEQKDIKIPTGVRMLVRRCCNAVLRQENFEGSAEISVTFVNNEQIHKLNLEHRNIDRETDVLSLQTSPPLTCRQKWCPCPANPSARAAERSGTRFLRPAWNVLRFRRSSNERCA